MNGTRGRRIEQRRGSAMVEFALSMLVLAPIAYGTLQYGYGFFLYNEIVNALRAGARYASMRPIEGARVDEFKSAVQNMAACGNPANCAADQGLVRGLTAERIGVEIVFERNVPSRVSVRLASFPFQITGLPPGKPEMSFPYLGQWAP